MYPAALQLHNTTISSEEVHFLGMSICDIDQKIVLDVFDKRREFPFAVCRYPHQRSLLPASIAHGVFTGLLHRFYRICTEFSSFSENAAILANTMTSQGWHVRKLRDRFRIFIQTRLGLKWKLSLKHCCTDFARRTTRFYHGEQALVTLT